MTNTSFYSYSFGCRVNHAEKEKIDRELTTLGYLYKEKNPNFYLINSCVITQKAEKDIRSFINQIKKKNPKTKIVLIGCAATYWKKINLYKNLKIDLEIENNQKNKVISIIKKIFPINNQKINKSFDRFTQSNRYIIKIQDGCNRFCSYCIVPFVRNRSKSKKIKEIISEINRLPNPKEIILTAINTEHFGIENKENLTLLLENLLTKTNIEKISFGSINPWSIDNKLISFFKKNKNNSRIAQFFHIPIQSGSNKILKKMRRDYTKTEIIQKISQLHKFFPLAFFSTDIIVGFPQESEKDFNDTLNLVKKLPISKIHVFRYSMRKNTVAANIKEDKQISEIIKKERSKILLKISSEKLDLFKQKNIGSINKGLFIVKKNINYNEAILNNQITCIVYTKKNLCGNFKKILPTSFKNGKLFGKIMD